MEPAFIVLVAVWLWPISALLLNLFVPERPFTILLRWLWIVALVVTLCWRLGISTQSTALDWMIATLPLLPVFATLWFAVGKGNLFVRILANIGLVLALLVCIFSGSLGFLGIALAVGQHVPRHVHHLTDDLLLKEYGLGAAFSDYRGLGAEAVLLDSPLPGLERSLVHAEYFDFFPTGDTVLIAFDPQHRLVRIHQEGRLGDDPFTWTKELLIP